MPFDPNYPPTNAPIESAPLRAQFTGLKDLIDALPSIGSAVVDAVNTVPQGSPAAVSVSITGSTLHFTIDLPQGPADEAGPQGVQGSDGSQGPEGPAGQQGHPASRASPGKSARSSSLMPSIRRAATATP